VCQPTINEYDDDDDENTWRGYWLKINLTVVCRLTTPRNIFSSVIVVTLDKKVRRFQSIVPTWRRFKARVRHATKSSNFIAQLSIFPSANNRLLVTLTTT